MGLGCGGRSGSWDNRAGSAGGEEKISCERQGDADCSCGLSRVRVAVPGVCTGSASDAAQTSVCSPSTAAQAQSPAESCVGLSCSATIPPGARVLVLGEESKHLEQTELASQHRGRREERQWPGRPASLRLQTSWPQAPSTCPPRCRDAREEVQLSRGGGAGGAQEGIGSARLSTKQAFAKVERKPEKMAGKHKSSDKKVRTKGKRGSKGKQDDVANQETKEDSRAENRETKNEESPGSDEAGEKEATWKSLQAGKVFRLTSDIVYQKSSIQEKALECRDSERAFVNESYLQAQVRTQNKEKPCEQKECGRAIQSTSLHAHVPNHTANKCYRYEESGKVPAASLSLSRHMKTHTGEKPFECDICGKTFRLSSYLLLHSRIHTGIRPYKCKECGKAFGWSSHFGVRSQIHTRIKPYKCKECGKDFKGSELFNIHMRTHTGEQ
ncbi:zinc finger protein 37 homolog [Hippopotamus amphibius kiboko]|uniref:zinc finger protein 37 homolog n=1 Tax=Hippopotamus amphibius kiboko TaxID=575201 RepID=UPI0025947D28|nr:zinc finger protein 37 homolog [Hippopotamus amphibius kiboko]